MCIQRQLNNVKLDESRNCFALDAQVAVSRLDVAGKSPGTDCIVQKKWSVKMKMGNHSKADSGLIYLSDKQLASRYGVTRTTIWRWSRVNQFPKPVRFGSGCTRWALRAVEAWEERRESGD